MRNVINRANKLFSKKTSIENIFLAFISVLITASLSTFINSIVDTIHEDTFKTVTISFLDDRNQNSTGNDICIVDNSLKAPKDAFKYIHEALEHSSIDYNLIKEEGENSPGIILIDAKENSGRELTFRCPYFSNTSIDFITNSQSGKITIECDGFYREYDLYKSSGKGTIRCTPICESYAHLIPYVVCYLIAFILSISIVYLINNYVIEQFANIYTNKTREQLLKYNVFKGTIVLFIVLSSLSLFQYFHGEIPGYLEGGDQNLYWNQISAISNVEDFKSIPDFRGYLCYLIPAICKSFEFHFGINAVALWIIYLNFLAAVLFGAIFPLLAKKICNSEITHIQVYLPATIMFILLRGLLSYVLMDFPAAVFYLAGFTLFIYLLDNPGWVNGLLCGLCFSISANLKINYQFVATGTILIWITYFIVKKKRDNRLSIRDIFNWKNAICVLSFSIGFMVVCIPELLINISKGVISLTPFQTETSWNDKNYMIEELAASRSFENMRLYPGASKADLQIQNIKIDYIGDTVTLLNYQQLFEMFMRKPIDTLIYMAKKIFIGLNTLDPFVYSGRRYTAYKDSLIWLQCLLNYIVIFGGIFSIFKKTDHLEIKAHAKMFLFANFLLSVLPATFGHVEWRGYLIGYLIANFFFCYLFVPIFAYERSTSVQGSKYLNSYYKGLSFFLAVTIIICATIT